MKRIGIMGCGAVADFGHAPGITGAPGLELFAVYDPVFERAVALQKRFGVPHAFCDEKLFFQCGLDAVTVSSPAPFHRANVEGCAAAGLPVLCEKPLAMNDAEALSMIETMRKAGLPLAVGFCYRFSPVALEIKRLVAQGAIGRIGALRLIYIWDLHGIYEWTADGKKHYSPRRAERMREGGPMVDCGVHQIDLARWWLGDSVEAEASAGAWLEEFEAPDHMYLHLRHSGGALSTVETSYTYTHTTKDSLSHFTYQLIGTDGLIRYDRESGLFELRRSDRTDRLPWSHEKNFEGMYSEFRKVLETGDLGEMPTGEDGLIATRIARQAVDHAIAQRTNSSEPVGLAFSKSSSALKG